MMIPRIRTLVASALVVASAACASAPAADTGASGTPSTDAAATDVMMITVNHNKMDNGEMTVYIEPAGGVRTVLGIINAGELKTFRYTVTGNRNIRLGATGISGGAVTSPAITVPAGQGVNWDIALNTVRIRR